MNTLTGSYVDKIDPNDPATADICIESLARNVCCNTLETVVL